MKILFILLFSTSLFAAVLSEQEENNLQWNADKIKTLEIEKAKAEAKYSQDILDGLIPSPTKTRTPNPTPTFTKTPGA